MRIYKLLEDLPFMKRFNLYAFDDETGEVYLVENNKVNEYPLRIGLASYLNLLRMEGNKYLKEVKK
jgi:hypothetical protein